jgi:ribosomal protein S18 acetylase RimI-like enzyme
MTGTAINIRPATIEDAATIADLSRSTFYETFAAQNSSKNMDLFLSEQFTWQRLVNEVGSAGNTFLLAYYEGQLSGYVKLRQGELPKQLKKTNALEIARIYASKQFIGKGVGKALMQSSINIAKERNLPVIWLAVWENNERALQFYKNWGFQIIGSQIFLLGHDLQKDWLMKKDLE